MRPFNALNMQIPSLLPAAVRDAVFPALRVVPTEEARQHIFRQAISLGMSMDDGIRLPSLRKLALGCAAAFVLIMLLAAAVTRESLASMLISTLVVLVLCGALYVALEVLVAWWPVIGARHSVRQQLSYELNWLGFTHCRHCCFNLLGRTTSQCPECGSSQAVVLSESAPYRSFHIVRLIHAEPERIRQAFTQPALRHPWWPTTPDETRGRTVLLCSGPQDQLVFRHTVKTHYTIAVQISPMGDAACVSWLHTSARAYDMCDPTTDPRAVHARLDQLVALVERAQNATPGAQGTSP